MTQVTQLVLFKEPFRTL